MDKGAYLNQIANAWSSCRACPRLVEERKNMVFGMGNPDAEIMIVGEAPGANEEEKGLPFVGKAGQYLDQFLAQVSVVPEVISTWNELDAVGSASRDEPVRQHLREVLRAYLCQDYFFTNVIMCRPPENADPIPQEMANCHPRLLETIYTVDPILIIACGRIASEGLLSRKVNISSVRGELFDMMFHGRGIDFHYPVIPIFHTSYLMRKNDVRSDHGDTKKTFDDINKAHHIYDELKLRHDGTPKPTNRPPLEK